MGSEARTHFRAVCRALVSESLELSTFLEKVSQCDAERAEELKELDMQDWVIKTLELATITISIHSFILYSPYMHTYNGT